MELKKNNKKNQYCKDNKYNKILNINENDKDKDKDKDKRNSIEKSKE